MSDLHQTEDGSQSGLFNTKQAANYLNLGVSTLNRARCEGWGPKHTVLGTRAIRYRQRDLDAFIEAGLRQSTSERAA
ncbi:helix-turn-helix domain-containing protein [Parvularcula oceani]|uniref:helix-turn-helix transcriptional regulator n=1 Tax=Parvularcula oceani TaxID=1247963 RepID=UPI00192E6766